MTTTNDLPIVLHKNGTATLELAGDRILLRMPKVREYEQLRLAHHALGEQIVDVSDEAAHRSRQIDAQVVELGGRDLSKPPAEQADVDEWSLDDDTRAQIKALRREQRALRSQLATDLGQLWLQWIVEAIELLRTDSKPLPDVDELPNWLTNDKLAVQLITHWQTAPLARGGG